MPEIQYKSFDTYLESRKPDDFAPVYLIFGDEFLFKTVLDKLLKALLPDENRNMCCEFLEGDLDNTPEAIERVNTFNLLGTRKVVVLGNSHIFHDAGNHAGLVGKAKAAAAENDLKKASRFFLEVLGLSRLTLDDLEGAARMKLLDSAGMDADDADWIEPVIAHCRENNLSPSSGSSHAGRLQSAVEKGFPRNNHLVITTDHVDKRRSLYTALKEKGVCIDCSVPKGERKADKEAQSAILSDQLALLLKNSGKSIEPKAASAVFEMIGFDLNALKGSVEKLISFAGERKRITLEDVNRLLSRSKIDPIFELTNAVSDRKCETALFYAHNLMANEIHPLQILAALTNQLRKLFSCRALLDQMGNRGFHRKMSFPEFTRNIMPIIEDHDKGFLSVLEKWEQLLNPPDDGMAGKSKKKKQAKSKIASDLVIAKNTANAYPVYQMMIKADHFSMADLTSAMTAVYEADRLMKSTAINPKLILDKTIISICNNGGSHE